MTDRLRLSQKARSKLLTLASEFDLDPSFLQEYLITRYGIQAARELTGCDPIRPKPVQQISATPVSDTNPPKPDTSDPAGQVSVANRAKTAIEAILEMDFE